VCWEGRYGSSGLSMLPRHHSSSFHGSCGGGSSVETKTIPRLHPTPNTHPTPSMKLISLYPHWRSLLWRVMY